MSKQRVWLVSYDIADSGRLRRVATICLDYGVRFQKSLFSCDVSGPTFREMWGRLVAAIDPREDSLLAYPLSKACLRGRITAGCSGPEPATEDFLF